MSQAGRHIFENEKAGGGIINGGRWKMPRKKWKFGQKQQEFIRIGGILKKNVGT